MTVNGLIKLESSVQDVDTFAEKSFAAFKVYRNLSYAQKADFLEKIAAHIDAERKDLAETGSAETALPVPRLDGEITRTVNQLKLFASLLREGSWVNAIIDTAEPERKPLPKPDLRLMQQPIGPVAVFGASNFPFAFSVAGGDTASALAAGCPVVYKVNSGHPQTSAAVARLVLQAATETGMPEGVFSMIGGKSHEIGQRLVAHPRIKAVGFTGSLRGGRALFDIAAARPEPIPVYAEMGSTNPVFILPQIMKEKGKEIAAALAASNTASVGQFCTNPGIMISTPTDGQDNYLQTFTETIRNTPAAPMLHEGIFRSFVKGVEALSENEHVSLLACSENDQAGNAKAHLFRSTANDLLTDERLWEEVFGPSSIQVTAGSTEEMFKVAEALPGQITITVWGTEQDLTGHRELLELLASKAGRIIINGVPTGVEVAAAMNHGGPYPATTDCKFTSVGTQAIYRFTRPVCYQNYPEAVLPAELRSDNPRKIWRQVNGKHTNNPI